MKGEMSGNTVMFGESGGVIGSRADMNSAGEETD